MYSRTPRFKKCVQAFADHGRECRDKVLLSVLSDNAGALEKCLNDDPGLMSAKYSLACTYTPLHEASLMHLCAEYNHTSCARVLVDKGADINQRAGTDEYGSGRQTPIFHTVNQNQHNSAEMMHYLLSAGADLTLSVKGLIWGTGYEWETFIPAVNPLNYAMMGLLPHMHRDEITISGVITTLLSFKMGLTILLKTFPAPISADKQPTRYLITADA